MFRFDGNAFAGLDWCSMQAVSNQFHMQMAFPRAPFPLHMSSPLGYYRPPVQHQHHHHHPPPTQPWQFRQSQLQHPHHYPPPPQPRHSRQSQQRHHLHHGQRHHLHEQPHQLAGPHQRRQEHQQLRCEVHATRVQQPLASPPCVSGATAGASCCFEPIEQITTLITQVPGLQEEGPARCQFKSKREPALVQWKAHGEWKIQTLDIHVAPFPFAQVVSVFRAMLL